MPYQKIRRALFPIAGLGTRFLPATKVIPKEMLPIVDIPVIELLVEEVVNAGVEEVIFVTSRGKGALEDHFDTILELEIALEKKRKKDLLERIKRFENKVTFAFVRQYAPLGDGHAIICAKHLLEGEPFLVVFGDDLISGSPSSIAQLLSAYEKCGTSVIGVQSVEKETISSYGVVNPKGEISSLFPLQGMIEKPSPEEAPSQMAIIGKYICTPGIWDGLHNATTSQDGELRLIDGFLSLIQKEEIFACEIQGERFDVGTPMGFLKANIAFGMEREEYREELLDFIRSKIL
jgi:UTP--glucose-1-phosphate uridylyltransferase